MSGPLVFRSSQHLFVYGSLCRSHPSGMHRLLQPGSRFIGAASLQGRLYDLGDYPGVVDSMENRHQVRGELYRLDDPVGVLTRTDDWEGCAPHCPEPWEYQRVVRPVTVDGGTRVDAWVYLYGGPLPAP